MKTLKRTWADISLDNLEYNYRSIRAHLPQGTKFLGVMKADAYGHGAVPVSRALADLGAEYLAVSNLEEAVQIRRGEVRLPILILGYTPAEYAANMIFLDITQEVHSLEYAREPVSYTHLNVHFLGLKPNEQLPQYLAHFDACLNLFAKSDLSKDVSPLKFYEYLSTGRPIVSTRQPDQILQYAPLIEIADSQEEFIAACEASLADTAPERTKARIEAGRACSWDSRVAQMCEILQEQGIL